MSSHKVVRKMFVSLGQRVKQSATQFVKSCRFKRWSKSPHNVHSGLMNYIWEAPVPEGSLSNKQKRCKDHRVWVLFQAWRRTLCVLEQHNATELWFTSRGGLEGSEQGLPAVKPQTQTHQWLHVLLSTPASGFCRWFASGWKLKELN